MNEHQLDWAAFQYLAGELNDADCQLFEALLAEDEQACLALTRAVSVAAAVGSAAPTRTVVKPMNRVAAPTLRKKSPAIVATVLAACCVLLAGLIAFKGSFDQPKVAGTPSDNAIEAAQPDAARVMQMYASAQSVPTIEPVDSQVEVELDADSAPDDGGVPAWMLAAIETEPVPGNESGPTPN